MTKLTSNLVASCIVILASSSVVSAANLKVTHCPLSPTVSREGPAAQEAYADRMLSVAAANAAADEAPGKSANVPVRESGSAAQEAYADKMLSVAAANSANEPVESSDAEVVRVGPAAQEAYADQTLTLAASQNGDSGSTRLAAGACNQTIVNN